MINEAIVEQAALDWLRGLGYEVLSGRAVSSDKVIIDYKRL